MSKQNKSTAQKVKETQFQELGNTFKLFPFQNHIYPIIILIAIGFIFNFTAFNNEYALDDGIIIHQNEYVLKGASGIKEIMTKDAYDSFYRRMNAQDQLAGGRYRPLSVVSFALEQELIGTYRTGAYAAFTDINRNGTLESTIKIQDGKKQKDAHEYNEAIDFNNNGTIEAGECLQCWDANKNGKPDMDSLDTNGDGLMDKANYDKDNLPMVSEDLNKDGVINEIDCQNKDASLRHIINVITYILGCLLLYFVFRNYMFRDNHDWAFLAALIFLMHPIHTEVVANVKSRDEIFSLIFISLTFLYSFKFLRNKSYLTLFIASIMFLLALLSKEYAITLLALVPCAFYVFDKIEIKIKDMLAALITFIVFAALMVYLKFGKTPSGILSIVFIIVSIFAFSGEMKKKNYNTLMIWFYGTFLIYLALRLNSVVLKTAVPDNEILNNPYLLAKGDEKIATKIYVLLKYVTLLWYPHPLSSDYSFNTIAYRHITSWDTLLSLVMHIGLAILSVKLFLKRHIIGFALLVYFAFLMMIGNIIMDIGATMGERLIFHSSIGFVIILSWLVLKSLDKLGDQNTNLKRAILFLFVGTVGFLYGCKTWERNHDWKNDVTLFIKDVETVPNSVLALGNAGARWVDLADTKEHKKDKKQCLERGLGYLKHAVELHPRYVNGYLNLGLGSYKLGKDEDAIKYWGEAKRLYPNNPYLASYHQVFYNDLLQRGFKKAQRGQVDSAIYELNKTIQIDSLNPEGWYNLGGAYHSKGDLEKATYYWERCLKINPSHAMAKQGMTTIATQKASMVKVKENM